MSKVLLLFATSDEQESKSLKDHLQRKLGTRVNLITVKEAIADGSTLQNELAQSRCVVLINSKQSAELVTQGTKESEGKFVLFDGSLIQEQLKGNLKTKLIVVQFGQALTNSIVPTGYDKEVFVLSDNFNSTDAVLDQIEDTIKGFLSSKVNHNETKKEKKCIVL